MSRHPLTRRDTRVRFSIDNGSPLVGDNPPGNMEYRRGDSFPVNTPEPVHTPRTHEPVTRSRSSTWSQPGPFSPPRGYYPNPYFDGKWGGGIQDAGTAQPVRPMVPGSRFSIEADETASPNPPQ
ncbi:hypothetical protein OPQ81_004153 [Rhizoctonia solani]|nr:hypothetical protein OPQ81_004153 [Rhizoctonia solani]